MSTEQARKEIVEETLSDRDEMRRALIEGLEKDIGDGLLDALIAVIKKKDEDYVSLPRSGMIISPLCERAKLVITALEDVAISYANSVNIEE